MFSLPPFPLPLLFSVKNMVMKMVEVVYRPFPFVFIAVVTPPLTHVAPAANPYL